MLIKTASLTSQVLGIIHDKKTEYPFTGSYHDNVESGTYLCRQCGLALFRSQAKFASACGWPSFDEEIKDSIKRLPDTDGKRTEIFCARCNAHLGHVFQGEGFTAKNIRHCVNSLSLDFVADSQVLDAEEAIFAAGCFWGVDYYFKRLPGVLKVEVGYTGGRLSNPSYEIVCSGQSGHFEAVRVIYDKDKLTYEAVIKYFFEIHDPTQTNGQGPDIGQQYQSVIFYYDKAQKQTAEQLIAQLKRAGLAIDTQILPVKTFWPAEAYHQNYYEVHGKEPYCHYYTKRFT